MSVILKDIDTKKRAHNDYGSQKNKMKDIDFYTSMAKKCISMFAGSPTFLRMLKDEDAISHVAEHIMWGHVRWDENRGRALKSYLNQCGIWAIKIWKTKMYHNSQKNNEQSLNHNMCSDTSDESQLYQIIADKKCFEPHELLYENKRDEALKQIQSSGLTELQQKCLTGRYLEGKKLRQIAESLSVSRQAVNQHIKKGIAKLRKENGIC